MKMKFFISFLISSFSLHTGIIINEFMPAPEGEEPEWIEIYNPDSIAYDIPDLRIFDLLNLASCSLYVKPYSYAIITSKPDELKTSREIPDEIPVIKASLPGLNNTFDAIVLKNKDGILFDSAYYNMDFGEKGKSFERIDTKLPPYGDNISISNDISGATAGYRNSISIVEYDAGISDVILEKNQIHIKIINYGEKNIDFSIICEIEGDIAFTNDYTLKDTIFAFFEPSGFIGSKQITAYIKSDIDQNITNDTLTKTINFPPGQNTIFINEIMFDTDDNSAEYIELYNNSNSVINLRDYSIYDEALLGKSGLEIKEDLLIQPEGYVLFVWDSVFFDKFISAKNTDNVYYSEKSINLNKSDDIVVVKSSSSVTLDSLHYFDEWHNSSLLNTKNVSLEKISNELNSSKRESWSSCTDESGGTPGLENSVKLNLNSEDKLSIKPNPFSPYDFQGFSECIISFNYDFRDASITARIYDKNGAILRELKNSFPTFGKGIIKWDGRNDNGYKLQPAPYILLFEIKNNEDDKIYVQKRVIVIGK
jgi:hypothetical protein